MKTTINKNKDYYKLEDMGFKPHFLANGQLICITSKHGFRFSDGTEAKEGSSRTITAVRDFKTIQEKPFRITESRQYLKAKDFETLSDIANLADIVIVPRVIIAALADAHLRDKFKNVVGFNSTPETQRSPFNEKILDVNNWAW